jgi:hypothetical protein
VFTDIVTNIEVFNFPILGQFNEHVLIELVETLLELVFGEGATRMMARILVQIREHHGLRKVGFDMLSGASVTMTTGSNFEIKRTVDFVFFRAVD